MTKSDFRINLIKPAFVFIFATVVSASSFGDIVRVINSPQDAAQIRVDLIQQAKSHIDLQYYEFGDDHTSQLYLSLLRQAALGQPGRPPVTVRLIVDGKNNLISPAIAKILVDSHIQIKNYHPFQLIRLTRSLKRMHDKILVVDGTKLLTGGRNIADSYFEVGGEPFIDRDIYAEGENSGQAAEQHFEDLWNSKEVEPMNLPELPAEIKTLAQCYQINDAQEEMQCRRDVKMAKAIAVAPSLLDGIAQNSLPDIPIKLNTQTNWAEGQRDVPLRFLHDDPGKKNIEPGIYGDIVELMKTADDSIYIETPFLIPSAEMMALFKSMTDPNRPSLDKSRPPHPLKIRILTNSLKSGSSGLLPQAGYEAIKQKLLDMKIDLWETKETYIHAKSYAIDDKISIIGSFNFDIRSQKLNSEVALAIYDAQVNAELRENMESHLAEAQQMDPMGLPMAIPHRFPNVRRAIINEMHLIQVLLLPLIKEQL